MTVFELVFNLLKIIQAIKPTFQDLCHPSLLEKCLQGYTQNSNESINNLVWKFAPKKKHHGLLTVKSAVSLALGIYNDGAVTLARVMRQMGLDVGLFAVKCFTDKDTERVATAQRESAAATYEARIRRRQQRLQQDEQQATAEGHPYQAGAY